MAETRHTPGRWAVPAANVFRVVAPEAPHQNRPQGRCPPYVWAIVAETDPDSVGGEQAAANALLIAAAPELLERLVKVRDWLGRLADAAESSARSCNHLSLTEAYQTDAKNYRATAADLDRAIAKAEGRAP